MVTPSPRGAVSRAGPATHAVETSTRDKGSATAAAAAGRSTKKNRASSTLRLAFEVWGWVCVSILVYDMYEGLDERRVHMLNVYYQAPVVVTVACVLWAHNLQVWHRLHLTPSPLVCFGVEHDDSMTFERIYRLAQASAVALLTSMVLFLFTYDVDKPFAATSILMITYVLPMVFALWPNKTKGFGQLRAYLRRLIYNCATPLARPVGFADFFFADILCSLAKSMSDLERVVCSVRHGIILIHTSTGRCGDRSWKIPAVLIVPSVIRFLQCLRQYSDTRETKCLYNALKYMSAFPVIIISGVRHSIDHDDWTFFWRPLWIGFCVFNTCFSFYWDIKHDWALSLFGDASRRAGEKIPFGLRERRLYGAPRVYYREICLNFAFRIVWTYKLASHLRHHSAVLWLVTMAEATRRFRWSPFRVEVEYLRLH